MTQSAWIIIAATVVIGAPILTYLCAKYGHVGWLKGKQYYLRNNKDDGNSVEDR